MTLITYAQASAQDLLEAIPAYDALDCDMTTISVAWVRFSRTHMAISNFRVRNYPFPSVNFSSVHLILLPLVREENGRRTLAPVAAFLVAHGITHIRIVGSGMWDRRHQYSRDGGLKWGNMPTTQQAPAQPAPTQVIEPRIPPPPPPATATEEELRLWDA